MLRNADGTGDAALPAVSDSVREALLVNIRRRMTPQPIKIRADVEMTCFGYDGVIHIKAAMRAAQAVSTPDCVVKMKLVAPPLYVLTTSTLEKEVGVALLLQATAAAASAIEEKKGRLVVKEAARAVSERDEKLLAEKLEKLQAANEEVAGDDSDEEDETMGSAECVRWPADRARPHPLTNRPPPPPASTRRPCPPARGLPRPRPRRHRGAGCCDAGLRNSTHTLVAARLVSSRPRMH